MSFVLDASVACAWVFRDETTPALDALLARVPDESVFVPIIWRTEVMNVLIQSARHGRISNGQAATFWEYLEGLGLREATFRPTWAEVSRLCDNYGLTAYDAHYLALAIHLGVSLSTIDDDLSSAALDAGVEVLGR